MNGSREWVQFYESNLVANNGKNVTTSCHNVNTKHPHWVYGHIITLLMLSMAKQSVDRDKDIKKFKTQTLFICLFFSHSRAHWHWFYDAFSFSPFVPHSVSYFTCKIRAFFMTTSLSFDTNFLYAFITPSIHTHTHSKRQREKERNPVAKNHADNETQVFLSTKCSFFYVKKENGSKLFRWTANESSIFSRIKPSETTKKRSTLFILK